MFFTFFTYDNQANKTVTSLPSLLDYVRTSKICGAVAGILHMAITDHCPTFLFQSSKPSSSGKNEIPFRSHSVADTLRFENCLDWDSTWKSMPDVADRLSSFVYTVDGLNRGGTVDGLNMGGTVDGLNRGGLLLKKNMELSNDCPSHG